MKAPDNLTVIRRKKKERKAPHFKMGGGRKMDELRKMHLRREMSSFKMSDHAFPFILLTDFLRLTLPKLRWQMKQPIHALPAGGARKRIQHGKRLGRCTFETQRCISPERNLCFLQWLARVWSLTFTKAELRQPSITRGSALGATGRCECVGQRCSTASTTPFVWRKLCHGSVELGGQKWKHGHGDQDITSASCWDIYLNPSIQQCANSGPITEVPLRAVSAFPILFLLGWKWESNLPFFFSRSLSKYFR